MDGIFLSEELGVEKPNAEFFDKVFAVLGNTDRSQAMIVGDSLTSDILGGSNAGIVTCWYNPNGKPSAGGVHPNHEISDLHEVFSLI